MGLQLTRTFRGLRGQRLALAVGLVGALATPPTVDWRGSSMRIADRAVGLGGNVSGLTFDGSGGVWAVRDDPSTLLRLQRATGGSAAGWTTQPGRTGSRGLRYPGGRGAPDAEAVTVAGDDPTAVYVAAERDASDPGVSRNAILRFDTSTGGTLTATKEWTLNSSLPKSPANTGIEGLAWIPDAVFVGMGLTDRRGKRYAPADHPGHGTGLFVAAAERTGMLYVLALDRDGEANLVASMPSGLPAVMELTWSEARQELWAVCDDACDGRSAILRPRSGGFRIAEIMRPPAGMATLNTEGMALDPQCNRGSMAIVWSDDAATGGQALREATLPC